MPGTIMAMARFNRPCLMVYGGNIRAGSAPGIGRPVLDIVSAFQSYGEFEYGKFTEASDWEDAWMMVALIWTQPLLPSLAMAVTGTPRARARLRLS
jgi:hypothetical protein